jgi:perosamine synthetase
MIPRFSPTAGWSEILAFLGGTLRPADQTGAATAEFERAFADYLGCDHAVFAPSGRMALWLILKAFDYPEGSEIIVPGFTYFAIPAVIQLAGLKPVYADIDPATYELSAESVESVISERTRAVIPTHLFGRTCDLSALQDVCSSRGIAIIEDCAQCMGASVGGKKAGTLGEAAYFTFGITKNFTTFGGGMVTCKDAEVYEKIQRVMSGFHSPARGKVVKESLTALAMRLATRRPIFSASLGLLLRGAGGSGPDFVQNAFEEPVSALSEARLESAKWRPTAAQARAGLSQLKSLDAKNQSRRERGHALVSQLQEAGCRGLPEMASEHGDHIYVSFALTRENRYAFARQLRLHGVDAATGYMSDCASIPELGGTAGSCPHSAYVAETIVHLPLYPDLSERDLSRIAAAVAAADEGGASFQGDQ